MTPAVEKYLERYAEPDAKLGDSLEGPYDSVLVVPVLAEPHALLRGLEAPFRQARGRGLLILVVNAPASASAEQCRDNELLLGDLARHAPQRTIATSPPSTLLTHPQHDLLVIDRASEGFRLGAKEGVGRARRIGCDIALALAARGVLRARGVGCSDADANLPSDYFQAAENLLAGASVVLFPFRHRASGDRELDEATWAYELSLRYYVLGLAHAASPYAFHCVGSTLYLDLARYAEVRGFANRQAGEDFYLLSKIVKTAPARRLLAPTVEILSRRSSRVPFGTGPGVARLLERRARGEDLRLYAPATFQALRAWLSTLDAFSRDPTVSLEAGPLSGLEPSVRRSVFEHLEALDAWQALKEAAAESRAGVQLRRRLHTWFDAFRTLKFVHAVRDSGHPELPFPAALAEAPFVPGAPASVSEALKVAKRAESQLPAEVGLGPF